MDKKYKALAKDSFIFAIGSVGSKIILFLLVPLYTNFLSTEEYGIADLIFTISQFLVPIASLVISDAVLRFGISKSEKKEDVLLAGFFVFGCGSLFTVAITPLIGLYKPIAPWKWQLCIYTIIYIFMWVEMNYLKATDRNKLFAIVSIVQTLVMALSNVFLIVVFPLGVDGYVYANILGCFVGSVIIFVVARFDKELKKAKFSRDLLKRMIVFSAPLILNNVSWWVIFSANKIVVELYLGAAVLGIYTVATKIPSLINVLVSVFQSAWGISATKEIESSNDTTFYSNIFKMISTFSFGISIFVILILKPLMKVYVGADFFESWVYIPLLLVGATFSALSAFFVSLYAAMKKSINNTVTTLIGAVASILICVFLSKMIGLWAAILGTFLAYFLMAITRMVDTRRYIKVDLDIKRLVSNSVILISQAVLVSLDIQVYLVSVVALILYGLVNINMLRAIYLKIKGRLFRKA